MIYAIMYMKDDNTMVIKSYNKLVEDVVYPKMVIGKDGKIKKSDITTVFGKSHIAVSDEVLSCFRNQLRKATLKSEKTDGIVISVKDDDLAVRWNGGTEKVISLDNLNLSVLTGDYEIEKGLDILAKCTVFPNDVVATRVLPFYVLDKDYEYRKWLKKT